MRNINNIDIKEELEIWGEPCETPETLDDVENLLTLEKHCFNSELSVYNAFEEMHGEESWFKNDHPMTKEVYSAWLDGLQADGMLHKEQVNSYDWEGY